MLKFGVYLYTLILLGYQASQRWRALLLRGPGQGRKLAQPSAGQAPLGLAGCSLELAKHSHAELSSRDSGPVTLSCFPPTSSVGLSLKSPGLPTPPPRLFPSLADLGNFEVQSAALSEIQKEVLCFPGGSSLMFPLFSGTKLVFSGEGGQADSSLPAAPGASAG